MGKIQKHLPVKLISAVTYHKKFDIHPIIKEMEDLYSSVDMKSEPYDFTKFTSYYGQEMGEGLLKIFVSFVDLFNPENLPSVKVTTNNLEDKYIINHKRQVNIDPGYITQAKLVLATTKNYNHRVYIGKGIFGDVHMHYGNSSYQTLPWTYPDYQDKSNVLFFNSVRKRYLEQLAAEQFTAS